VSSVADLCILLVVSFFDFFSLIPFPSLEQKRQNTEGMEGLMAYMCLHVCESVLVGVVHASYHLLLHSRLVSSRRCRYS